MALPEIVSREEWLAARTALLGREKEVTRRIDAVNADRRRLPMVRVDTPYRFRGKDGEVTLADLFEGRRQLIVQHVMFGLSWDDACPSCTASVDELSVGVLRHLAARDTTFVLVSRAPYEKLDGYRARRGWTVPWYSSHGTGFNFDFDVSFDPDVKPQVYNYQPLPVVDTPELPGLSCFLKDGDEVFHTYSTYARGADHVGSAYGFLDLTALGRQEAWEEPTGRVDNPRVAIPDFS
ncbi:DUF899 domain-containing protein [Dactylosporangium fulvum]|uniref:DUF899 domain-containing protein n=1 Tax=Dactylosporangium fulvum TaxID=53359 RepID=A0ABY5W8N7_9ACTN|nr:DUF899 domain-containing protein [Dactylosporangium fulvum]UWP86410.1 DUF899 domain-containing protein [Dactylosporangium fulvum]